MPFGLPDTSQRKAETLMRNENEVRQVVDERALSKPKQPDTQPLGGQGGQGTIATSRIPPPARRDWVAWAVGTSLIIGAGALSRNTCNVNTGIQVIHLAPPSMGAAGGSP